MSALSRHPPSPHDRSPASLTSSTQAKPTSALPITLTKRLLFPQLPPGESIPPLLASPSAQPALNAEFYDLIALALRAYVNPWWTRITRYDKDLLPEAARLICVVLRALESRVLAADLSALAYRDLPSVLYHHYADYRASARVCGSSYASGGSASFLALFHARQQHIGVTPDGKLDEVYVRTLIDVMLQACLPQGDWEAEPERYIIREVLMKLICIDVVPKISQSWFIHQSVLNFLGPVGRETKFVKPLDPLASGAHTTMFSGPSFQTLVVSFLSAVQAISSLALTLIHFYKLTLHTIRVVNHTALASSPSVPFTPSEALADTETTNQPFSLPSASDTVSRVSSLSSHQDTTSTDSQHTVTSPPAAPSPVPQNLIHHSLALVVEMFTLRDRFASSAIVSLIDMIVAAFSSFFNRYVALTDTAPRIPSYR